MPESPRQFTSCDALETYTLLDCLRQEIGKKEKTNKNDRFTLRKIEHLKARLFSLYPQLRVAEDPSLLDRLKDQVH